MYNGPTTQEEDLADFLHRIRMMAEVLEYWKDEKSFIGEVLSSAATTHITLAERTIIAKAYRHNLDEKLKCSKESS